MARKTAKKVPASAPLLVELLTEELPPKSVRAFGEILADRILNGLVQRHLKQRVPKKTGFATARRLAVLIPDVDSVAPDRITLSRLMPAKVAFDANGNPTVALQKRLEKDGLSLESTLPRLERKSDDGTEYVYVNVTIPGMILDNVLSKVVEEAIEKLPIAKPMRWGAGESKFVRPVHGLVMLHGSRVVRGTIFGLTSGRMTRGHRFLGKKTIVLRNATDYASALRDAGKVVANFEVRRRVIEQQIKRVERKLRVSAISSTDELTDFAGDARLGDIGACHWALRTAREDLLPEVTALVEFPVTYVGKFDGKFLDLPMECLTLSMRQHQRYFPCFDRSGRLVQTFLIVSNLDTSDPRQIIHGNERVLRARLADAKFFYDQDRRTRLEERVPRLANVVFHNKLGSQLQRVERLRLLAGMIARRLDAEDRYAERAAWLAKADLSTDMVGEFPELQGIMGRYYAQNDGESQEVADAIEQHYRPRFAGDMLPKGPIGCSVALADKLLLLAGLFGIQQAPTGDRDPFGLRRAALGIVRILVENKLALHLGTLIDNAFEAYATPLAPAQLLVRDFIYERFASYLRDHGYKTVEIDSVVSNLPQRLDLVPQQLEAVRAFLSLPEAESLAAANKRVDNLLKQAAIKGYSYGSTNKNDLTEPAEMDLFDALSAVSDHAKELFDSGNYAGYLKTFAALRTPVDTFFEKVMVLTDQETLRSNRLALLADLRRQMNRIADISKLAA